MWQCEQEDGVHSHRAQLAVGGRTSALHWQNKVQDTPRYTASSGKSECAVKLIGDTGHTGHCRLCADGALVARRASVGAPGRAARGGNGRSRQACDAPRGRALRRSAGGSWRAPAANRGFPSAEERGPQAQRFPHLCEDGLAPAAEGYGRASRDPLHHHAHRR